MDPVFCFEIAGLGFGMPCATTAACADFFGSDLDEPARIAAGLRFGGALLGLAAPWLLGFADNTKARNAVVGFALLEIAVVALSEPDPEVFKEFKD